MLADLCSTGKVKIVFSLDHIKAGLLFSGQILDQLNVVCVKMDTFREFEHEMQCMPALFTAKNAGEEIGWEFVLKSMTASQQKIVHLIAEHQGEEGVLLEDLFSKCVERMLAHSQKNLKE